MRPKIKITNPVPGAGGWITRAQAQRFVSHGKARWHQPGVSIEFVGHRYESGKRAALEALLGYDRAASAGLASRRQMRGVPIVGDVGRLLTERGRV